MKNKIENFISILSNIKWDLIFFYKNFTNKKIRNSLGANEQFKNIHEGKKCFIVGNGPSLKKMDLSKIHDELTFTVNNIMFNRGVYEQINTDYHVIIDPSYFLLDLEKEEDLAKIKLLESVNFEEKKPVFFTSIEGLNFYNKSGLDKVLNLFYLFQHKNLTSSFKKEINLTKNILSSQNVIQAAILAACYMGFKEIYLIGVDMTSIFLTFESNEDGEKDIVKEYHVYNYTNTEKRRIVENGYLHDNEFMLYDYAKTFTIFKGLKQYAEQQNIKIMNATVGGGLDVFDRVKYETLFTERDNRLDN
jgi:hypothetical protein